MSSTKRNMNREIEFSYSGFFVAQLGAVGGHLRLKPHSRSVMIKKIVVMVVAVFLILQLKDTTNWKPANKPKHASSFFALL